MKDILQAIEFFNKGDFFSSHDFFEELWNECEKSDRNFYQGMIQISVGCYHLISGNLKGSLSQLSKGIKKLKLYLPVHRSINLDLLLNDLEPILIELIKERKENDLRRFWKLIPTIKLTDKIFN